MMRWQEELRTRQFWRAMLAEFIATLVLVSTVLGSTLPDSSGNPVGPIYPAVAVGVVITAMVQCFGEISGAQVNPALTFAMFATRKLNGLRALVYIVAQCLGAFLGAGAVHLALPSKDTIRHFVNKVPLELNAGQALGIEVLCTFQMVFTVFTVCDQKRRDYIEPGNLAIGLAHSSGVLLGARLSGGSMNPARSLAPALITGMWENQWVYWIGPMIGAVMAGMSHEFFFAESASRQKLVACLTCKDIDFVETTSVTGSSLSTVTQNATRSKQNNKQENN